jgi:hypothetical protein
MNEKLIKVVENSELNLVKELISKGVNISYQDKYNKIIFIY